MIAAVALAATVLSGLSSTSYCENGPMADGTHTRPGSVAMNTVPLGTHVTVSPKVFGRVNWTVRDRIGYGSDADFWNASCSASLAYGRRTVKVRVVK